MPLVASELRDGGVVGGAGEHSEYDEGQDGERG